MFVEAIRFLMHQRIVKYSLRVHKLESDFAACRSQLQRSAASIQNAHGMDLTQSAYGTLHGQVQSRIGFNVLAGAVGYECVYICGEVPRKIHDEVAGAGRELRRSFQAHHASFRGGAWIDPCGDAAAGSGGLNCTRGSGHTDTASIRFHFHGPGDVDDVDAPARGLSPDRAPHFTEIDLAATGADTNETGSPSNSDIAADCFQVGASANLARANVSTTATQRSISTNVADIDVAASGECRKVPGYSHHLDVTAFGFQLGDGTAAEHFANSGATDLAGNNVSALGFQEGGAANISGRDVACVRVNLHAVIARHSDFELHPELRVGVMRPWRKEQSGDFHARGRSPVFEGVIV